MCWLANNVFDFLTVLVGTLALVVYLLQKYDRRKDAAQLIILQIDSLISGIQEVASRIADGKVDSVAFYEATPLLEENYWEKYKHMFVSELGSRSVVEIDKLYQYSRQIQSQQEVAAGLLRNHFFTVQQALSNIECQIMYQAISRRDEVNITPMQEGAFQADGQSALLTRLKRGYAENKSCIENVFDQEGITSYMPEQIRISLEKTIQQCALLEIKGTTGYKKLQIIAKFE